MGTSGCYGAPICASTRGCACKVCPGCSVPNDGRGSTSTPRRVNESQPKSNGVRPEPCRGNVWVRTSGLRRGNPGIRGVPSRMAPRTRNFRSQNGMSRTAHGKTSLCVAPLSELKRLFENLPNLPQAGWERDSNPCLVAVAFSPHFSAASALLNLRKLDGTQTRTKAVPYKPTF
jgi:hypothetical protein